MTANNNTALPDLYLISSYSLTLGLQRCCRFTQSQPLAELEFEQPWYYLTTLGQLFYHLEDDSCYVYRVVIPQGVEYFEVEYGHHDGASSFSFYQGLRVQSVEVLEGFELAQGEDIQTLMDRGLFAPTGGLNHNSNGENYAMWCLSKDQLPLMQHFIKDNMELYRIIHNLLYRDPHHHGATLAAQLDVKPLMDIELRLMIDTACRNEQFDVVGILCQKLLADIDLIEPAEFEQVITILGLAADIDNFSLLNAKRPVALGLLAQIIISLCQRQQFNPVEELYNEFELGFASQAKNEGLTVWRELIQWLAAYRQDELLNRALMTTSNLWGEQDKAHLVDLALATEHPRLVDYTTDWTAIEPHYSKQMNLKAACNSGSYRQVEALIVQGCDIHASSNSALHDCCELGLVGTARLLLANGADVNAWMSRGIRLANKYHFSQLKQLLLTCGSQDAYFS